MILAQLPPCCELKTSELVGQTLKWQVVGLALLATHVILTKLSLVTFFPIALFALGWLFYKASRTAVVGIGFECGCDGIVMNA
jgi:hypothetical protein